MRRDLTPVLSKYLDGYFHLVSEDQRDAMRRELRALLGVASAARPLLRHAQEWYSSEYADNPATVALRKAYDRLDGVGARGKP